MSRPRRAPGPRVVVLRALNLGDLLTGIPALRALGDAFADHHRVLATPGVFAPLVRREGLADEVVDATLGGPDLAVDLHGRGPGSQPLLLALRPRRLIAFRHPGIPETAGLPDWVAGEHEVERWCRLLSQSGVPSDPRRLELRCADRAAAHPRRGSTVIHPGAASPARRWPVERFAAVARSEVTGGRRVVITGGVAERPAAERVAAIAGLSPADVLAGATDLDALIDLVAAAGRVVSGDTGVAHLATALGTPSVVLFGPIPPAEWGPPADRPGHVALWSGRRGDPHAGVVDAGLAEIAVADVTAALAALPPVPSLRSW